jgi:chaperonin GroES
MALRALLLALCAASVLGYARIAPVFSRFTSTRANKIDGIAIDGHLSPVSNNVLVRVKEVAATTAGGLYIPEAAKERPTEGAVVAVGPGRVHPASANHFAVEVQVGHNVMYGKYDGTELKYNELSHQIIKDDDVLLTYLGSQPALEAVECVNDHILIKLQPQEDRTTAGVIVTTSSANTKRSNHGTVAKVGPGRRAASGERVPVQVAAGDGVRFREYVGTELKLGGEEYIVVKAVDILAKWDANLLP